MGATSNEILNIVAHIGRSIR